MLNTRYDGSSAIHCARKLNSLINLSPYCPKNKTLQLEVHRGLPAVTIYFYPKTTAMFSLLKPLSHCLNQASILLPHTFSFPLPLIDYFLLFNSLLIALFKNQNANMCPFLPFVFSLGTLISATQSNLNFSRRHI